ncbi:MAG: L,D-transpeptidase family protein [Coriobacteriia bacterium]|nr:L,D-transpeptidase family protein [Coriobacteriia bacterium]
MRRRMGILTVAVLAVAVAAGVWAVPAMASESASETVGSPQVRVEDDDTRIVFSGPWTYRWEQRSSGWSHRSATKAGASVTMRFEGTSISLISPVAPDRGIARIEIDGSEVATVSTFALRAASKEVVWTSGELAPGPHTIKVTLTGTRERGSKGTWFSIDAFDVAGDALAREGSAGASLQESDRRLKRTGRWTARSAAAASGGAARSATSRGATYLIKFKGTAITWTGRKYRGTGKAEVLLDGKRVAIVGGSESGSTERRVLWAASGLANKTHTVTIRALGQRSSGAGTGTAVDVDAFYVSGTPLRAVTPPPFSYPWRTYIVIDKSDFKLYWVRNGELVKVYPIAVGKIGWTTPNGTWRIDAKYYSSGVYGPRKMRMFKQVRTGSGYRYVHTAYNIHGTNQEWVIGTRASHGCIRMYNRDVLELWPQVPIGTMVVTRD